jgi:hypothetical protein
LGLTHYRVAVFYLIGALLAGAAATVQRRRAGRPWSRVGLHALLLAALALVLVSPWLGDVAQKTLATARQVRASSDGSQYDYITLDFVLGYGLRKGVLIAGALAALWSLARARSRPLGALTVLWLAAMLVIANPSLSGVPSGFLTNGTVILALYLPASILIGLAVGDLFALTLRRVPSAGPKRRAVSALFGLLLIVASGAGAYQILETGRDDWYALVLEGDTAAMAWIEEHTPTDATFAVGSTFWLEGGATCQDGGLWLPYIARRATLMPPMIYISEGEPAYIEATNERLRALAEADSPEDLAQAMEAAGARYAYVGQRGSQPWQAHLEDARVFEAIYRGNGVRVYRVR